MEKIIIKPHHFMDIIRFYGLGVEVYEPDVERGNALHTVAAVILSNHQVQLQLTGAVDDICAPCLMLKNQLCIDKVFKPDYEYKQDYNEMLDKRLFKEFNLSLEKCYTATQLCQLIFEKHNIIYHVWREADAETTKKRHDAFVLGAQKFLK